MKSIFTIRQSAGLQSVRPKRFFITLGFLLATLSFTNMSRAQTSPADCKTGCTSNDVQIKTAYLSNASGIQLPQSFVCPGSGHATVYLTLELTTKTPRIGVVIYAKIKHFTAPSTIGAEITTISECFGVALNQPTNKVTFTSPFNWTCGDGIVLTDVFLGWGTGNTNFCTGTGFQCPATSSKCYSLPSGQYIPIVTPNAAPASAILCSTEPGGTTAIFDLTSLNPTVSAGQSNVTVSWFTDAALTNAITTPASYTSATGNVYAKVTSTISPYPYSSSTVALTVNTTPAAPTLGKVDNCDGTSTITATGLVSGATLTWSDGGSGNPRTVSATTALTVTQTVNSCTSSASNSVTPAPKTTPAAPTVNVANNCDGSSDLTAGNYTGSLLWSNSSSTASIHVTNAATYTVTQTIEGCTSLSGSGISAPKTTPSAASICVTQPSLCGPTTGSVTVTSPTGSGLEYSINNGGTWQTGTAFSDLAPGSVSGIKVKNADGCISTSVNCDASSCSPTNERLITSATVAKSPTLAATETISKSQISPVITEETQTTVKAFPNPFNDQVKFEVYCAQAGTGTLEIFNILGQKVKTVYQGFVPMGINNFELRLPGQKNSGLVYKFRLGGKQFTGKLLQVTQ